MCLCSPCLPLDLPLPVNLSGLDHPTGERTKNYFSIYFFFLLQLKRPVTQQQYNSHLVRGDILNSYLKMWFLNTAFDSIKIFLKTQLKIFPRNPGVSKQCCIQFLNSYSYCVFQAQIPGVGGGEGEQGGIKYNK